MHSFCSRLNEEPCVCCLGLGERVVSRWHWCLLIVFWALSFRVKYLMSIAIDFGSLLIICVFLFSLLRTHRKARPAMAQETELRRRIIIRYPTLICHTLTARLFKFAKFHSQQASWARLTLRSCPGPELTCVGGPLPHIHDGIPSFLIVQVVSHH